MTFPRIFYKNRLPVRPDKECVAAPLIEAVAKGKIVWAGNMLPVAVQATRPPCPKIIENLVLAQQIDLF